MVSTWAMLTKNKILEHSFAANDAVAFPRQFVLAFMAIPIAIRDGIQLRLKAVHVKPFVTTVAEK